MSLATTGFIEVQACPVCGKLRRGQGARGWPPTAHVCPRCSVVAHRVLDLGVERDELCPVEVPA
jgi:hypothetical protein